MINFTYNGYSLQSNGITTTTTDVYSTAKKTLQAEKLAEADGSVIVKETYESKTFTVEGYMVAASVSALDSLIDTFKTNLNNSKQNFDFDYAGGTRRYIATPQNIIVTRDQGLNTAGWSLEFFCEDPVGQDTTSSTLFSATTITTSSTTKSFTVNGSYKAEPYITLTVTSVTGGSPSKTITLSNGTNLIGLSITRSWANGDVLEVDCMNRAVYVNSVATNTTGLFPSWSPGSGSLNYVDDFTARSVSVNATYTKRWL